MYEYIYIYIYIYMSVYVCMYKAENLSLCFILICMSACLIIHRYVYVLI